MASWLYTIDDVSRDWDTCKAGTIGEFWTPARQDPKTGALILREDGCGAGQPRWRIDDEVLVYNLEADRCVAVFSVWSDPDWDREQEAWNFSLKLHALDWKGPRPRDLGLTITQGARKRIDEAVYRRAHTVIAHGGAK